MSDFLNAGEKRRFGDPDATPDTDAVAEAAADGGEEDMTDLGALAGGQRRSRFDVGDGAEPEAEEATSVPGDSEDGNDGDGEEPAYNGTVPEDSEEEESTPWTAPFSRLGGDSSTFAGVIPTAWRPDMQVQSYIGITDMLLHYLVEQESRYAMTMPIHACGIDPVVFEHADYVQEEGDSSRFFSVTVGEGDDASERLYELVEIDGELYMSCISDFLNRGYFEQIITAATCAIKEHGQYIFPLVGLRSLSEDPSTGLLNTMRLNSYELNALISYMSQFSGVQITSFTNEDGHECLSFQL